MDSFELLRGYAGELTQETTEPSPCHGAQKMTGSDSDPVIFVCYPFLTCINMLSIYREMSSGRNWKPWPRSRTLSSG